MPANLRASMGGKGEKVEKSGRRSRGGGRGARTFGAKKESFHLSCRISISGLEEEKPRTCFYSSEMRLDDFEKNCQESGFCGIKYTGTFMSVKDEVVEINMRRVGKQVGDC